MVGEKLSLRARSLSLGPAGVAQPWPLHPFGRQGPPRAGAALGVSAVQYPRRLRKPVRPLHGRVAVETMVAGPLGGSPDRVAARSPRRGRYKPWLSPRSVRER